MSDQVLTRDAIFKADDLETEKLDIPEWGGSVYVRTVTCAERDALEGKFLEQKENNEPLCFRVLWAVACTVDADGNRYFSDEDAATLGTKSGKAVGRIFNVAQRLSGMTDDDVKAMEKNSETTTSGDSSSD